MQCLRPTRNRRGRTQTQTGSAGVNIVLTLGQTVRVIHGDGGKNLQGAEIETYEDHRMAMSLAVAGLRVPGIKITGEECVAKSFPDFWQRFALLANTG